MSFFSGLREHLARLRLRFRGSRDALALALLGLAVGACAGLVSIAFRGTIDLWQFFIVPSGGFGDIPDSARFALPVVGAVLTIGVLYLLARGPLQTGVVHVLERLDHAQGRLPLKNAIVQFIAAALLLVFGMSMGREGPAIHLGAASGCLIGERLRIAQSALRTLVGCGVAAAIGAAFNTPLAGVILAVEVVLIEYTVGGFTPILLAAVSGATLGRLVYGDAPAFAVPEVVFGSLWELPWIAAMGIAIGAYSAAFITLAQRIMRATCAIAWWIAMLGAGVLVGAIGIFVPQVLGIGYDVIELTLKGQYTIGALAIIAALKLVATAAGVGARMPAGLIGPTLVMGAAFGGIFGVIGTGMVPAGTSNVALYAMLGMAAMMGATLQAPLSALVAVLELTANPNVILPGILAIVTATLTTRHLFKCDSIFEMQLQELRLGSRS